MRRAVIVFALAVAACGPAERANEAPEPRPAETRVPAPSPSVTLPPYIPPPLTPEAEKGEKGARNLLLTWARMMENRAFGNAYRVFGDYAGRTGMSATEYAAAFADYRTVTVAISEGAAEGACGSLYYEVPVTLTGTTQSGESYVRDGTIVLRRVNDVDGATPAQLRWHLDRLEWDD